MIYEVIFDNGLLKNSKLTAIAMDPIATNLLIGAITATGTVVAAIK